MLDFGAILSAVSGDEIGFLDKVDLGVLAALAIAYTKMWIVPGAALTKAEAALEKKDEELKELRAKLDNEVLPQLWRTTELLARFANSDRDGNKET